MWECPFLPSKRNTVSPRKSEKRGSDFLSPFSNRRGEEKIGRNSPMISGRKKLAFQVLSLLLLFALFFSCGEKNGKSLSFFGRAPTLISDFREEEKEWDVWGGGISWNKILIAVKLNMPSREGGIYGRSGCGALEGALGFIRAFFFFFPGNWDKDISEL